MNTELNQDERVEKVKRQWEEAERGSGGLKRLQSRDFLLLPNDAKSEVLIEPVVLTSDGVDKFVVMTVEEYFARIPPTTDPIKKPLMKIFEDRLFRECI